MKELFLLRGLPGSGKSTLAKMLVGDKDYCHKEADMYFVDGDGNYKFQPSKIKEAHKWCKEEIEFSMKYEHSPVVVSNTFTQEWEMEEYYKLAEKYGYRVRNPKEVAMIPNDMPLKGFHPNNKNLPNDV